jgi:tetraacyldisaccharide 4'-kinase
MGEHTWIKIVLRPFSWLYGLITDLRNLLYDSGIFSSRRPSQFVFSVGNLTVGGTGKTPVVNYLADLLAPSSTIALLSRGYGRKTKGFVLADEKSTAADIGDEPLQLFNKLKKSVVVAVCEDRAKGAAEIAKVYPERKLLLLDDAFQHRGIFQDVKILLNDYNRPFYADLPFPAGRLRENRKGAKRADAIIVTKCPPTLDAAEASEITTRLRTYCRPDIPIFFCYTGYADPMSFGGHPVTLKNVKMVAGIADPRPFDVYLSEQFNVSGKAIFPDHYNYTLTDVEELIKNLKNDTFVVTTEKDMVKLKPLAEQLGQCERFAYVPISIHFKSDKDRFSEWVRQIQRPYQKG